MPDDAIHEFATAAGEAADDRQKKDDRSTVYAFLCTLFVFKVVTIGAIFWAAGGSSEAGVILAGTSWFWLSFPIIVGAGPAIFFLRKRRVRRKRAQLLRAEWVVD